MSDSASGSDLLLNEEQIRSLLTALDQEIGLLNNSHGKLSAATDQVATGWAGDASRQFYSGQTDANFNLNRLIKALENLRTLVEMSRNDFTEQEQEQIADMRLAQSGLQDMGNPSIDNLA
ncbi:WXG100 family type VII secretion target [Streptomyces sp. URMC 129]|uniref:WXG100 family type VII secretion target n=1 Tax=Streptomyces sp. URMC 129 TaxID=3423407 RepID=UPI003F1CF4B9